jgi:hypothetical protein
MHNTQELIKSFDLLINNSEMAQASTSFLPRILELGATEEYFQLLENKGFLNFYIQKNITSIYLKSSFRNTQTDELIANILFDELFKLNLNEISRQSYGLTSSYSDESTLLMELLAIKESKFYQQLEDIYFLDNQRNDIKKQILVSTFSYDKDEFYIFEPKTIELMKKDYLQHKEENNLNRFFANFDHSIILHSNFSSFILQELNDTHRINHYFEKLNKDRLFFYQAEKNSKMDNDWLRYPNQLNGLLFMINNSHISFDLFKTTLNHLEDHVKGKMRRSITQILEANEHMGNFTNEIFDEQKTPYFIDFFNIDKKYLKMHYSEIVIQDYDFLNHYFGTMKRIYPHEKLFELKHLIPSLLKDDDFFNNEVSEKFLLLLDNVAFKQDDKQQNYANVIKFLNHQPIQTEKTNILREVLEKQYLEINFLSSEKNNKKMKI